MLGSIGLMRVWTTVALVPLHQATLLHPCAVKCVLAKYFRLVPCIIAFVCVSRASANTLPISGYGVAHLCVVPTWSVPSYIQMPACAVALVLVLVDVMS